MNIGCYHLWYYDVPDRERIWTIIFRVVHTILPAVVPDPGPGVAIPRHVPLAVYHLFLCCQKHLLSNHKAMYLQYKNEYDRCSLAGYDVYTCHHRGVYAGNASWAPNNQGNPMAASSPQFPNLVLPAPNPAPVGLGGYIRKERGPPQANLVPQPHICRRALIFGLQLIQAQCSLQILFFPRTIGKSRLRIHLLGIFLQCWQLCQPQVV